MVPRPSESVLRRGQALMELGRRATSDTALLHQVADMIRDPENGRLIAVGTVPLSQLGTAVLIAGGGEPAAALAYELAAEWEAGERSDFAWLMKAQGSHGGRSLSCAQPHALRVTGSGPSPRRPW
jgi:hypothetical protein